MSFRQILGRKYFNDILGPYLQNILHSSCLNIPQPKGIAEEEKKTLTGDFNNGITFPFMHDVSKIY